MQKVNRDKTQDELDAGIPHDHDHTAGTDHNPAAPEETTDNPQTQAPKTIGDCSTCPTTIVDPF